MMNLINESDRLTCTNCGDWFVIIYNIGTELSYCPLCGREFTEEELNKMCEEAEED